MALIIIKIITVYTEEHHWLIKSASGPCCLHISTLR